MTTVRASVFLILGLLLGCGTGPTNPNAIATANSTPPTTNSTPPNTANSTPPTTNFTPPNTANPSPQTTNANSVPVTLKVTECSGVASCQFVFSLNGQVAVAATSTYVAGYVGDSNLPFSGGSVTFQLVGESTHTYLANSYSGAAVYAGWNPNYGSLYQVSGNFSGTDAATNKVVNGSVSALVGIKGHSGRGGGNQYNAVNGSMAIN